MMMTYYVPDVHWNASQYVEIRSHTPVFSFKVIPKNLERTRLSVIILRLCVKRGTLLIRDSASHAAMAARLAIRHYKQFEAKMCVWLAHTYLLGALRIHTTEVDTTGGLWGALCPRLVLSAINTDPISHTRGNRAYHAWPYTTTDNDHHMYLVCLIKPALTSFGQKKYKAFP